MMEILNDTILYVGEHLSCNQYMHDITYGFTLRNVEAGFSEEVSCLSKNVIVFTIKGKYHVNYDNFKNVLVGEEEFIFLSKGSNVSCRIEEDSTLIFFTFDALLSGCDQNLLESCNSYVEGKPYNFAPLKMREPIQHYCFTLKYCLERKVNCSHFHELKHKEFFMFMRYFYTKEEIANFFYPIIGVKSDFKQFILQNWKIGMSIDDIISLMPMSKSTFIRTFDEYFKMTPYSWYQKLICYNVVQRAVFPRTTIKDLMNVAQISDASQFNRFCRRNFNCTPKKLLEKYSKMGE